MFIVFEYKEAILKVKHLLWASDSTNKSKLADKMPLSRAINSVNKSKLADKMPLSRATDSTNESEIEDKIKF